MPRSLVLALVLAGANAAAQGHLYRLACGTSAVAGDLRTPAAVNAIRFQPGDTLRVASGSDCQGSLELRGSGTADQPIRVLAEGEGAAPVVRAAPGAEQAVHLQDGSYWEIAGLEIQGGTRRGLFVEAASNTVEHIVLRDLYVHDVFGVLRHKEDGLVVVLAQRGAAVRHVRLDGVIAANTNLWSGIFVSGAENTVSSDVMVVNSIAHDVQGDGIVLFQLARGTVRNATAWHTGMQHSYTIGTPNAIWTWRCNTCTVEQSEAFLVDSPGVDGGAFDIDFGNIGNRVLHNFAHHTQGYCVSVFGAFGETRDSEIAGNTCLHNGQSPRLAARQGAIFFMTWSGGSIVNTSVHDNAIDWQPAGNTPAFQAGALLNSQGLRFFHDVVSTSVNPVISPLLSESLVSTGISVIPPRNAPDRRPRRLRGHRTAELRWIVPPSISEAELREALARVGTLAMQFDQEQLKTTVQLPACDPGLKRIAMQWFRALQNIQLQALSSCSLGHGSLQLRTDVGVERISLTADRAALWRHIAEKVGGPTFSSLTFVEVAARD